MEHVERNERTLALDIETTTEVVGLPDDRRPGLDPAISAVTDIALSYDTNVGTTRRILLTVAADAVAGWTGTETYLTSGRQGPYSPFSIDETSKAIVCVDETQLLELLPSVLREVIDNQAIDRVVTWNGGVFDLPFLSERGRRMRDDATLNGMLELVEDPTVFVKYATIDGFEYGCRAEVAGRPHLDLQAPFKAYADANGVTHSLKPVGTHAGLDPVTVDPTKMHLLSTAKRWRYVLSDADVTRQLELQFRDELDLASHIDRLPASV